MIWGDDNLKIELVINKCHLFFFLDHYQLVQSKSCWEEQI